MQYKKIHKSKNIFTNFLNDLDTYLNICHLCKQMVKSNLPYFCVFKTGRRTQIHLIPESTKFQKKHANFDQSFFTTVAFYLVLTVTLCNRILAPCSVLKIRTFQNLPTATSVKLSFCNRFC